MTIWAKPPYFHFITQINLDPFDIIINTYAIVEIKEDVANVEIDRDIVDIVIDGTDVSLSIHNRVRKKAGKSIRNQQPYSLQYACIEEQRDYNL